MKKLHLTLLLLFNTLSLLYSQETIQTKSTYTNDTLQGRYFGNFIKPADGFSLIKPKNDVVSPYFKKCDYLKTQDERQKCFVETFYEQFRKKLRPNRKKIESGEISLIIKFTINSDGIIEDISFPRSNDSTGELEKEIIRILNKMPKIIPAKKDGKFIGTSYSFPLDLKTE